jgi:flavodoxin
MKKLTCALALISMFVMNAFCNQTAAQTKGERTLVLYYSQGGTTEKVATTLQQKLGADIEAIELQEPYDPDYKATLERCRQEREQGIIPSTLPLKSDLSSYDRIFLGYPIWFGTYALPIFDLLRQPSKLDGKEIVVFCTFGSGGLESSIEDLKKALPNAKIGDGYGVRTARIGAMEAEVNRFLIEHGYIDGKIEPLPGYGPATAVSDADRAIFDQACGSYQFPLGTPVSVSSRATSDSVDYKFTAQATNFDGQEATFTIYVTVPKATQVAEFTRVVR